MTTTRLRLGAFCGLGALGAAASAYYVSADAVCVSRRRRRMLLSDIDGTLIGGPVDAHGGEDGHCRLRSFNTFWEESERPRGSVLCLNTARSIASCSEKMAFLASDEEQSKGSEALPKCEVLITGEGTEVRWLVDREAGTFVLDAEWDRHVRAHWDRDRIAEVKGEVVVGVDVAHWSRTWFHGQVLNGSLRGMGSGEDHRFCFNSPSHCVSLYVSMCLSFYLYRHCHYPLSFSLSLSRPCITVSPSLSPSSSSRSVTHTTKASSLDSTT